MIRIGPLLQYSGMERRQVMKRTAMVGVVLVLLLTAVWPNAGAQGPLDDLQEPIDDLTPRSGLPDIKVDKSDELRVPEAYIRSFRTSR